VFDERVSVGHGLEPDGHVHVPGLPDAVEALKT
jgi:hypothetical protein